MRYYSGAWPQISPFKSFSKPPQIPIEAWEHNCLQKQASLQSCLLSLVQILKVLVIHANQSPGPCGTEHCSGGHVRGARYCHGPPRTGAPAVVYLMQLLIALHCLTSAADVHRMHCRWLTTCLQCWALPWWPCLRSLTLPWPTAHWSTCCVYSMQLPMALHRLSSAADMLCMLCRWLTRGLQRWALL